MAIGTAAHRTLRVTASMLADHEDEDPRIAGLVSKMRALSDSVEDERAADRLTGTQEPGEVRKAERDYLRRVSPAAADAFEAGHAG